MCATTDGRVLSEEAQNGGLDALNSLNCQQRDEDFSREEAHTMALLAIE